MKYQSPIRSAIAAALLLSFAGTASAFTLEWFPRVPGLEDETFLVYTSTWCGLPDLAGTPKLTLVNAERGDWHLEMMLSDGLICGGVPPGNGTLYAMPMPDHIDGIPVTRVDVTMTRLLSDYVARYELERPVRAGLPPSIVGTWFNADFAEQGFFITLTQREEAVVTWDTYAADGSKLWLSGVGKFLRGDPWVSIDLTDTGTGVFAGTPETPEPLAAWGSVEVEHLSCGTLRVAWRPEEATGLDHGEAEMTQLTAPASDPCDLPSWAQATQRRLEIVEVDVVAD